MAPSCRASRRNNATRSVNTIKTMLSLGKVSKPKGAVSKQPNHTDHRITACEKVLAEQGQQPIQIQMQPQPPKWTGTSTRTTKRKREEVESSDDEASSSSDSFFHDISKKKKSHVQKQPKFRPLTPPHSQSSTDSDSNCDSELLSSSSTEKKPVFHTTTASRTAKKAKVIATTTAEAETLPDLLQRFISLHAAFVKALSLHFAHNGASTPAELNGLAFSITRIWKKSSVSQLDLQRMLALYEIAHVRDVTTQTPLSQQLSPFRLVAAGLGLHSRTNIELSAEYSDKLFREREIQNQYEKKVLQIFELFSTDSGSFIYGPELSSPIICIPTGSITMSHRQKASSVRAQIFSKSKSASEKTASDPDLSKLSISDQMIDQTPISVKSRTSSLFDRVRAKGIANAATAAPTSEQLTRRHAIARIPEIVDFLRMKQSQKLSTMTSFLEFDASDADRCGSNLKSRTAVSGKISFSMSQITREIRESVAVPVGLDEVQMVLRILARELPELGGWVQVFEVGRVASVTLNGTACHISGRDVGRLVQDKQL